MELHRVADQVLEQLHEQAGLAVAPSAARRGDDGTGLLDASPRAAARVCASTCSRSTSARSRCVEPADAGERQQVVDELLHALGAVDRELDVLVAALVELALVAALEQLAEARDLAQRLLQVVRGDVGELLELGVGPAQVLGLLLDNCARLQRLVAGRLGHGVLLQRCAAACGRPGRRAAGSRPARPSVIDRVASSPPSTLTTSAPSCAQRLGHPATQRHQVSRPSATAGRASATSSTDAAGTAVARARGGVRGLAWIGRLQVASARPGSRRNAACPRRSAARRAAVGRRRPWPCRSPARRPSTATRLRRAVHRRQPLEQAGRSRPASLRRFRSCRRSASRPSRVGVEERRRRRRERKPRSPVSWSEQAPSQRLATTAAAGPNSRSTRSVLRSPQLDERADGQQHQARRDDDAESTHEGQRRAGVAGPCR